MKFAINKLSCSLPFMVGLLLGMYFVVFNVIGLDFTYFPGDLGDARFNNYILEHSFRYFTGQEASFWNAPFMHPENNIVSYSDNLVGTAPIYSIFRFIGYDTITSFQFWVLAIFMLNYACCYFFLKWSFKSLYPAVLGAFIFAFSLALQSQMTHAQVFPRFFIPLALWMCLLFMKELKPIYFFATLFMVVLQFYAGIYLGFMLVIPIGCMLLVILFGYKRKLFYTQIKKAKWVILIIGSFIINISIAAVLMVPYYYHSKETGINSYASIVDSIPTVRSFFYTTPGSLFWDGLSKTGEDYPAYWDHQIFPGLISIICAITVVLGVFFRKKLSVLRNSFSDNTSILFIAGAVTFLLFVRYQGYSLYWFVYQLPGFGSMRSLTRIINVELIFFAIGISFVAHLMIKRYANLSIAIFLIFMSLLVADNYMNEGASYRTKKSISLQRVSALKEKMKSIPQGSIVSYEPINKTMPAYVYQLDAMLATQDLGLKSVNGYSATAPLNYHFYWDEMNESSRLIWFDTKAFDPDTLYVIN